MPDHNLVHGPTALASRGHQGAISFLAQAYLNDSNARLTSGRTSMGSRLSCCTHTGTGTRPASGLTLAQGMFSGLALAPTILLVSHWHKADSWSLQCHCRRTLWHEASKFIKELHECIRIATNQPSLSPRLPISTPIRRGSIFITLHRPRSIAISSILSAPATRPVAPDFTAARPHTIGSLWFETAERGSSLRPVQ